MATPEKIAQYRNAQGFTGLVVKDDADAADGTLLGGHIVHAGMINPPGASTAERRRRREPALTATPRLSMRSLDRPVAP